MRVLFLTLLISGLGGQLAGQYEFKGVAPAEYRGEVVYLDILDGWNHFRLISDEQPLRRATIDSSGFYHITGNGLPPRRGFYRLRFLDKSQGAVSMNFARRHFIHFVAGPNDSIQFVDLGVRNPDTTNKIIAKVAGELDGFNREEMKAETPRLRELLNGKRRELLAGTPGDGDAASKVFLLGNWPDEEPPLNLLLALESELEDADLRSSYAESLRADIGALDVVGSRAGIKRLKWWLGGSVLLNLLLILWLWRRGRGSKVEVDEQGRATSLAVELSPKEEEILAGIVAGETNKAIAARLFVSEATVKSHINSIYKKAGIGKRKEAIAFGRKRIE